MFTAVPSADKPGPVCHGFCYKVKKGNFHSENLISMPSLFIVTKVSTFKPSKVCQEYVMHFSDTLHISPNVTC